MTEPFAIGREESNRVESFVDTLPLDGTIISLRKDVHGIPLSLRARHITSHSTALRDEATRFDPDSSFLLFNISGSAQNGSVKIGFMDWEISNELAVCRPLQHYIRPQKDLEHLGFDEPPKRLYGFYVEEDFRRNGVGDFLTALSLSTLRKLGINDIFPGTFVTDDSISRWKKFGIDTPHWPKNPYSLPLAAVHPQVNRNIAAFV